MTGHLVRVAAVLLVIGCGVSPANASPIIYNFEAPEFSLMQSTPLLARTPNIGPATFLTDFTASPTASPTINAFTVLGGGGAPNALFSGQFLIDAAGVADALVLTFNTPIYQLQVDFGLFLMPASPAGHLMLTTPVGSTSQAGGAVGGSFQGGTLNFTSVTPFVTAQLAGFSASGTQIFFGVDDLVLDTEPIPEPATVVMVLTGLAVMVRRRFSATQPS
jgi:hypothetical protein